MCVCVCLCVCVNVCALPPALCWPPIVLLPVLSLFGLLAADDWRTVIVYLSRELDGNCISSVYRI